MRLVIHNRQGSAASGLRRYRGSGIFSSIGRKLFSSGIKKVINVATKANLPQKIANAVVNGAQSAGEKLGKAAGEKLGSIVRKRVAKKRPASTEEFQSVPASRKAASTAALPPPPKQKVDIDRIINGSGIIFQ